MTRRSLAAGLALAVLGSWNVAAAQTAGASSGGEAEQPAVEAPGPRTPPYEKKVREGIEAFVRGDAQAARATCLEAVQMEVDRPEAYYYLGVALRTLGDLPGATQAFRNALQRAEAKGDHAMALRARVGLADVAERSVRPVQMDAGERPVVDTEGLDRVQTEWRNLRTAFEAREEEQWAQVAEARAQAAFQVVEQDQAYVEVRKRIAEREREKAEEERTSRRRGARRGR